MAVPRSIVLVLALSPLTAGASAQEWVEAGDAPSFPRGAAQVTRGESLATIVGSTGGSDLRDAYCVKIIDPASFLATTDPATNPAASADFDTRLFLFRSDAAPALANDDTPPTAAPFLSTLTGVTTDGSGFTLMQPGEYVLVVAGAPDDPKDGVSTDLFVLAPPDVVAAPSPAAGSFVFWEGGAAATGSYTVFLAGVEPCQAELDVVLATNQAANRLCLGDDAGGFVCRHSGQAVSPEVALGFVDEDEHLDAVYADSLSSASVCFGNGAGSLLPCSAIPIEHATHVALGLIDDDEHLDAVLTVDLTNSFAYVCLGDGSGGFACSQFSELFMASYSDIELGFFGTDPHLDVLLTIPGGAAGVLLPCLGDGSGSFSCSNSRLVTQASGLALGYADSDGNLDAVVAAFSRRNQVCIGDGSGGIDRCEDVSGDENNTLDVALGYVDQDLIVDAVFANDGRNRLCLGGGGLGFTCSDVSSDANSSRKVTLGLLDGDDHLDAVFVNFGQSDRACFGDGLGGFSCSDLESGDLGTADAALGELGPISIFADGFESGDLAAWSQTVP